MDEQTASPGENGSETLNIEWAVDEAVRKISEAALLAGDDAVNSAKTAEEAASRAEQAGLEVHGMIQDALRVVREMAAEVKKMMDAERHSRSRENLETGEKTGLRESRPDRD